MYKCKYCGKEFDKALSLGGHITKCLLNPNRVTNRDKKVDQSYNNVIRDDLFCQYCGKKLKTLNSLKNHECRCKENPNRIVVNNLSNQNWSKGLTKETDERIEKQSISLNNYYKTHSGSFAGRHHSEETKLKISDKMTDYNHLNLKRYSWAKMGWYDNIWMMSTYELAYYIYTKDQFKDIKRCHDRFKYTYKNKNHYYTPDFIVDDKYIEIKGYETEKDKEKYKVVNNLIVLYYKDIKHMIEYVKNTYCVNKLEELYTVV